MVVCSLPLVHGGKGDEVQACVEVGGPLTCGCGRLTRFIRARDFPDHMWRVVWRGVWRVFRSMFATFHGPSAFCATSSARVNERARWPFLSKATKDDKVVRVVAWLYQGHTCC